MAKILICDPLQKPALEILESETEVINMPQISREKLIRLVGGFDALVVRARTKVDSEIIAKGKRLKVIARAGVGTDNIDVAAATERGILVVNSPDPSINSVAEHTFALLLSVCRRIPQAHGSITAARKKKQDLMGIEISGKTIGIIGLGRIGTRVATIAKGFGLNILASDPYASRPYAEKYGAELVDLERLLGDSDFVTLHVPLTESTRSLLGEREISLMKPGAVIINTSRAGVIDEKALLSSLEAEQLWGAGLDVFGDSFPARLASGGTVVLTPHVGASTIEAQSQIAELIAREVVDALAGRPTRNPVNMPYIGKKELELLQPFLYLTEKMVTVMNKFVAGRPDLISLSLLGEASEVGHTDFLLRNAVMGIMSPYHDVNVVNAMTTAERMGIKTEISRSNRRDSYLSSIELKVQTAGEVHSVKGALVDSDKPRIVGIEGYGLEFVPEGHVLITEHLDVPGMVGTVGTKLGSAGINIGTMHLARKEVGKSAMMIILADKKIPGELVDELRQIRGMSKVETIRL